MQRLVTICGQSRDIMTARDKYLHLLTSPDTAAVLFPVPVQTSARGRGPHRGRGQVLAVQGFEKLVTRNNQTITLYKSMKVLKESMDGIVWSRAVHCHYGGGGAGHNW